MADDNVIKFGKAKKSLARKAKSKKSAENRARFGLNKAEKNKRAELTKKMQAKLDAHKRDKPTDPE
jgi:hypothetical protein